MLNCYYNVLGVDQRASLDDIKKAYKRLALIYHPDKNNNSQEATEKFSLIQAAYEVLSDESERRWYDTHRKEILVQNNKTSSSRSSFTAIRVEELMSFFNPTISKKMDDSSEGFYTKIRNLFERLASEELAYANEQVNNIEKLPSFGNGKSPYIPTVKEFYEKWSCFSTLKSFSWVDQYKYKNSERKAKRIMEKENNKLRKIAIKEFNDAVKSLVNFIKKRDIRVKIEKVSETDRQASLLASSKAQAEKDRALFHASLGVYDEQEWTKINTNIEEEQEEKEEKIFECIICKKSFKSEKQFIEHEKTKKHIRSVNIFKKILKKESEKLNINILEKEPESSDSVEEYFTGDDNFETYQEQDLNNLKQENYNKEHSSIDDEQSLQFSDEESDIKYNSETSFMEVQDYKDNLSKNVDSLSNILDQNLTIKKKENDITKNKSPKNPKTKGKKNKNLNNNNNTCTFCFENFSSRNKLFDHVRHSGHAQPLPQLKRKK
ncbi:hypothetical protein PNEG_03055 [Pneumocystis murina B123]|uniref:J domain-containing protein n=1 Tax=Pneumocystis murina (strain B123) TaxID=1069680 RepID=M7PDN4_PNEMU|nr:hypothetical protein PNEG_03055 [Pneumocystis murina B123]EMR08579.1 hypothetical protein PNEG_03055 [Pneumocystis murina B123]